MASDGNGTKDPIEGYHDGKRLEMIQKPALLRDIQKKIKDEETKISEEYRQKEQEHSQLQEELNQANREFAGKVKELEKLKSTKNVVLEGNEKDEIQRSTKEAIEKFLVRRKPREEESNMTAFVDVHFQPGNETTGHSLHIGGEGAGSRDAKFTVNVSDKVESLAKQAAKYWGLDANMVFFLDHDGRIVPDKMYLRDIILPPLAKEQAFAEQQAVTPGGAHSTALATIPEGGALEVHGRSQDAWTVWGRNYRLTLVRATTVLDKEDLNKPKGETWNDFTFKAAELTQELEATRKKRGEAGGVVGKVQNLDQLPSLNDLIQLGLEKKAKKLADTRCRWAEFLIFMLCELLFYVLLLRPDLSWTLQMRLVADQVESKLSTFSTSEGILAGISSFDDITTEAQYEAWLDGPFRRGVVPPAMQADNLFVIGVLGYKYESEVKVANRHWCSEDVVTDPGAGEGTGNQTDCSNITNGSNSSNDSNITCGNATQDSNVGSRRLLREASSWRRLDADGCIPDSFKTCHLDYAVEIFTEAKKNLKQQVPECETPYQYQDLESLMKTFSSQPFSDINGKVELYSGGNSQYWNISNDTSFDSAQEVWKGDAADNLNVAARLLVVFVYNPTLNGLLVKRMLVEKTMAGVLVPTKRKVMLWLRSSQPTTDTAYMLVSILAIFVFLMELRRIFRCPRRWFQADLDAEESRDRCSMITAVFATLPVVVLFSFGLYRARFARSANDIVVLDDDQLVYPDTVDDFAAMEKLDTYILTTNLVTLVMFNALFFRYLLMYFPQLVFLQAMVRKLVKPVFYLLLVSILCVSSFAFMFYSLFGSREYEFRNLLVTALSTFRFAQGGFDDWYGLYQQYPFMWSAVMCTAFTLLTLILNNLVVAILVSHKKEKDLFENYSYHTFWASERSKALDGKEFNPAQIGNPELCEGNK